MNELDGITHEETGSPHVLPDRAIAENLGMLTASLRRIGTGGLGFSNPWLQLVEFTVGLAVEAQQRLLNSHERIAQLERLSVTDELTGLLNRRGIEERLRLELVTARRHGVGGVLIFIDLDGFKQVNDTFGHAAGDEVLRQVACLLKANVREDDSLGRLGGDEFVVVLPRSPHHIGLHRAHDIERLMNGSYASWQDTLIELKASCGAHVFAPEDDLCAILNGADAAMYQKKQGGRAVNLNCLENGPAASVVAGPAVA